MGTHPIEKIILDYENGRMTPEMAVGHSLQHISKLYESQTVANVNHAEVQGHVDSLEKQIKTLQSQLNRLTTQLEQLRPKRNGNTISPPKRQPASPP